MQEKKLKMSKSGDVQTSNTSQTRVGSTVSTAKSRGGPMVNANQIGVNTGAQVKLAHVASSVATSPLTSSTSVPATTILNPTTASGQSLTTVTSSGQTGVSASMTTGHLVTNTAVPSTHTMTTASTCVTTTVVTSQLSISTGLSPTKSLTNTTLAGQLLVTTSTIGSQKITGETPGSALGKPSEIPSAEEGVNTTVYTSERSNTMVQTTLTPVTPVEPITTPATLITQQEVTSSSIIAKATTTVTSSRVLQETKTMPTSTSDSSSASLPTTATPLSPSTPLSPPTMTPPMDSEASTASVPLVIPPVQPSTPTITSPVASSTVAVCYTSTTLATNSNNSAESPETSSNVPVSTSDNICAPSDASIPSTTASNPPLTSCNVSVEATTVLPVSSPTNTTISPASTTVLPISSTINTTMSSMGNSVNLLKTNVSTTYCTLPPVSSTLPAMIFDEPAETPLPSVANVPSNTSMTSSVTGLEACVADKQLSSNGSAGNKCDGEEPATNKPYTADPSAELGEKNNTDVVKPPVMNNTCSTLCTISGGDTTDRSSDCNAVRNTNDLQSSHLTEPISLSGNSQLQLNHLGEQEESMDVDAVESDPPAVKPSGEVETAMDISDKAKLDSQMSSDIEVGIKDGPKDKKHSSTNDNKDVTSVKIDPSNVNSTTVKKDSPVVEKMQVDDPKSNDTNRDAVTSSEHIVCKSTTNTQRETSIEPLTRVQDKAKTIMSEISDNKPATAGNTDEPTSVISNDANPKDTPNGTSTHVGQSASSATQDTTAASQVSATTSKVSAPPTQPPVTTSKQSTSQVTATQIPGKSLSASKDVVAPSQVPVSASQSTAATPLGSVSTVRIETTGGVGLNNLTPEKVLKFIADELMKESDAGKALLTGVAASISTSEGKVIIKPEPTATSTAGTKGEPVKPVSMLTTPGVQSSAPVRLILQTVPGHPVVPGSIPTSRIQVLKSGPQVVHTGVSQGKPLTPIAPAQRIVISNLPSGTVLGSQGQLLAKQGQVLGAQNISGTKVIRMTIPRPKGSTPVASSTKVVTPSKPSTPASTATSKTPVTSKAPAQTASPKPPVLDFPMRHPLIKDPKVLINMNLKKWKRRSSRKSIFVVDKNVVRSLARKGGLKEVQGFHYNTKWNSLNYPQDFPRPSFMTAWRYRTQSMRTLAAAAIQTRILNASMKWDEMNIRPPRGSSNTLKTSSGKDL